MTVRRRRGRVDLGSRRVFDFAVNRIAGPASKLPHHGFERPSHCAFGPDGHLYVVDWGEIAIAPERGGVRMQQGSGTLWRIRRLAGPTGEVPPPPTTIPLYALQYLGAVAGSAVLALTMVWLLRKLARAWKRR